LHPLREAGEVGVLQLGDHQGEGAVNPPRSSRPARLGTYPSSAIACSTRARVSAFTTGRSLTTLETVFQDTPACWATSLMLTRRAMGSSVRWETAREGLGGRGVRGYPVGTGSPTWELATPVPHPPRGEPVVSHTAVAVHRRAAGEIGRAHV